LNATIATLVLGAAILHVSWNALPKSGDDRLRSMVVMTGMASLVALPALLALPGLTRAVWPLAACPPVALGAMTPGAHG
jgi:hypothetical protein